MNRAIFLLLTTLFAVIGAQSQPADFSILGNVVSAYFAAANQSDLDTRKEALSKLFNINGTMDAVILRQGQDPTFTEGSWEDFVEKSQGFYSKYEVEFDEIEREVEFYLDMASVHCLVFQNSKELSSGTIYYQKLWFQFDLVFYSDRWFIDHIIWINETEPNPINNALMQDTIWHQTDDKRQH